jgi:hypothetical protein
VLFHTRLIPNESASRSYKKNRREKRKNREIKNTTNTLLLDRLTTLSLQVFTSNDCIMTMARKDIRANANDSSFKRKAIERTLNSLEKLFDDDSDCESVSSGESMANDADHCATEDFHIGAKDKVIQLWQGHLGSPVVNDTTTSNMENAKDSTEK